ncbi:MAG: hypothetical protein IH621_07850 [Krumholzibacteria bacterium]|nr:hypothetical protein [Candidatus Krumholzibacteria bacterium]
MKKFVLIVLVTLIVSVPAFQTDSMAINPWGGACDMAEAYNGTSTVWNLACAMHIQEIQECCQLGGCSSYPCG